MVTRSCSNLTLVAVSKLLKFRLGRKFLLTSVIVNQAHIKLLLFGHEEFQFWPNQKSNIGPFCLKGAIYNGPFLVHLKSVPLVHSWSVFGGFKMVHFWSI